MFSRPLTAQNVQNILHHVRNGHICFYKVAYCSKVPFMINRAICTSQVDNRKIIYKKYVKPAHEDHDHKNMRLKRPMSPHVTDYAPTVPSMTSIMQRVTGVVITFYALMLAGGSLFLSHGVDTYVSIFQYLNLSSFSAIICKLILGYPFCYHYFMGLRFVGFNMLKFLDVKTAYSTAFTSIAASFAFAFLFALR